MKTMKNCKKCVYCSLNLGNIFDRLFEKMIDFPFCHHPLTKSAATGKTGLPCEYMRQDFSDCGNNAELFKEK